MAGFPDLFTCMWEKRRSRWAYVPISGPEDLVFSTHRGHGHALAKGVPARIVLAELWGKATGSSGGRGGSMHMYAPEYGFMGTNGIVGAPIPLATGAALSAKLKKKSQVVVCFLWRWRGQQRFISRGRQSRRGLELAGRVCVREQFIRDGNGLSARHQEYQRGESRGSLRNAGRGSRRAGCRRGA